LEDLKAIQQNASVIHGDITNNLTNVNATLAYASTNLTKAKTLLERDTSTNLTESNASLAHASIKLTEAIATKAEANTILENTRPF
jgi:hypothetical protein